MKIGGEMLWFKTVNRFGRVHVLRVIVRKIDSEKVTVEAPWGRGVKLIRVMPERLREVPR
jgi:hypothetical protein